MTILELAPVNRPIMESIYPHCHQENLGACSELEQKAARTRHWNQKNEEAIRYRGESSVHEQIRLFHITFCSLVTIQPLYISIDYNS